MKYIFQIISLLFFGIITLQAQPKISFDKNNYDFGTIIWKNPSKAVFRIKNTGDKPLVISNVTTSCGCTVADWTKSPILPGKEGEINAMFDAKTLGHFNKTIGVYCNASPTPIYVSIKGEVSSDPKNYTKTHPFKIGSIRLDKEEITFDDVNKGDKPSVELLVANTSDKAYTPVLMHLPPYMLAQAIPEKITRKGTGKIKITIDTEKLPKFGLTQASVYLARFPGDKVGDDNEIPVSVVLLPDFTNIDNRIRTNPPHIKLSTEEIKVGAVTPHEKKSFVVYITNEGKSNLDIRDLQVFNSALGVQLNKRIIKPGTKAKMKVTVHGSGLHKVKGVLRILMITNDPEQPKIIMKVNANLKK